MSCRSLFQDPVALRSASWQDRRSPQASTSRECFEAGTSAACSTSAATCCSRNVGLGLSNSLAAVGRRRRSGKEQSVICSDFSRALLSPQASSNTLLGDSPSSLASAHCVLGLMAASSSSGSLNSCKLSGRSRGNGLGLPLRRSCHRRSTVTSAQARMKDKEPTTSSASLLSTGPSAKYSRLDSTLPLSSTASTLKASVRVLYSLATHGGLIGFGCLVCQLAGINILDTVHLDSFDAGLGLVLSLPPILVAAIMNLDPVADTWEVARGVRDAQDEELQEYYLGMTPSQYIPVAVASAVSQEVFFRAALQGGLALALHSGGIAGFQGGLLSEFAGPCCVGMAAISGYFPAFAPFSQLYAAVAMAGITGSFDYATSLRSALLLLELNMAKKSYRTDQPSYAVPKACFRALLFAFSVPNVIVTDGRSLRDLKTTYGEWYQRQQLKSIYAPMFTGLLALYFGLEWILVGDLMAPMISHSLFLAWTMQSGLARLEKARAGQS